jgi:hypothetical protein
MNFTNIYRRILSLIIKLTRNSFVYPMLYKSWWHSKFSKKIDSSQINYFSARPNLGAGIGHQMANWIAGYWFSQQFGLKFAHIPFSTQKWEDFLGFGENEVTVDSLIKKDYKKIKIPLFDESNSKEIELIKNIINSYSGKQVVFIAEQDQFYREQFGCMEELKHKFQNAKARLNDSLIYDKGNFNIAIHVRRGDITVGQLTKNSNLLIRWQDNDYFINVLNQVLKNIPTDKPIYIYLFSQGVPEDFPEFFKINNLAYCLDMNAFDSFLHMVNADLLITSKSSFSYKPALLSNGIKVCPKFFWHEYPNDDNWILANEDGILENNTLLNFKLKE